MNLNASFDDSDFGLKKFGVNIQSGVPISKKPVFENKRT